MFEDKGRYFELKELKEFNLSIKYTTKNYGNVLEFSKEKLIQDFSFEGKKMVAGYQTHSDNIVVIDNECEKFYFENSDGFLTNRRDIVIFTKYADCLPIFFYDKKNSVFGVVHSGWQGSYKEIAKKAILLMQTRFLTKLEDLIIVFGIGISKEKYEVQKDFKDKFSEKFSEEIVSQCFSKIDGKLCFDNKYFNYLILVKLGISKKNIIDNNLCTYQGNFHSYRRDGKLSGRNGAFISFE